MSNASQAESQPYLNREESFMYDREAKFPLQETRNAARIEYTEKGVMHMAARRCDILKISKSTAILGLLTQFYVPRQFYLDIPDARITKIGCVLIRTYADNRIEARFLRLLTDKELNRIFVYSTHPAHKDCVLDVRR